MSMSWHVDDTLLTGWVAGTVAAVHAASVEQHLVRCSDCRRRVGRLVAAERRPALPDLDDVWSAVRDAVELPRRTVAERGLRGLGLSDTDARLVAATPSLRGSWLGALCAVLLFVVLAAAWGATRGAALFLMVAPLVPVIGVALSYGAEADPALEQEAATPYPALRLVLLRSVAVLAACLPVTLAAGLLASGRLSYLWLLPALGFTAAVLAISTWTDPLRPAIAIALGWIGAVAAAAGRGSAAAVLADGYLLAYAALVAAGLLVLVVRSRRIGVIGGSW